MPWASDPVIKIDRFDGRALLDFLPSTTPAMIESGLQMERDEDGIGNELRFERWHDLADKHRLRGKGLKMAALSALAESLKSVADQPVTSLLYVC